MQLNKQFTFAILFTAIFASCTESTTPEPGKIESPNSEVALYSNLKTGNYWVYERYYLHPDGLEHFQGYDSLIIVNETQVNGIKVFVRDKFSNDKQTTTFLYDSATALYEIPYKNVLLNLDPDEKTMIDYIDSVVIDLIEGHSQLVDSTYTVEVPVGNFQCINYQTTIESKEADYPHGTRYCDNFYSKEIGLVKSTGAFYSGGYQELRLKAYGQIDL